MNIYDVIEKPIITEKVSELKGSTNQYVFKVCPKATKVDIKRAVEGIFKVGVSDVRTIMVHGKSKRHPRTGKWSIGHNWKKAVVALKKGNKIELFEGA